MAEFVIVTKNISELKKELALSVLAKKAVELSVATSCETRRLWFFPEQVASEGVNQDEVFFGLASEQTNEPSLMEPAFIETEDNLLILSCDIE